jgi:hypothetical protein
MQTTNFKIVYLGIQPFLVGNDPGGEGMYLGSRLVRRPSWSAFHLGLPSLLLSAPPALPSLISGHISFVLGRLSLRLSGV